MQNPMNLRLTFYANNTFDESGTVGGFPLSSRGNYSLDLVRNILISQEYNSPIPMTYILSNVTPEAFTATAAAGVLNFRKLDSPRK
jgi:hypothetical protein